MLSVTKKKCLILLLYLCKVYNTSYFFKSFQSAATVTADICTLLER